MKRHLAAVSYIAVIPLMSLIYLWIDQIGFQSIHTMYTQFDRHIPFVKWFILPYMSWMPLIYIYLLFLCFKDRARYLHTMTAYFIGVMISNVIFIFYQTTVPRPEIDGTGILTYFVQFVYQHDQPYNCFPSIHALSSYLLFLSVVRSRTIKSAALKTVISVWTWLIIISTVFVKQHSILDVAAGIILAEAVYDLLAASLFAAKTKRLPDSLHTGAAASSD